MGRGRVKGCARKGWDGGGGGGEEWEEGRGGEIGMGSTVGVEKVVRIYTLHACTTEVATLDCCLHPVTAPR